MCRKVNRMSQNVFALSIMVETLSSIFSLLTHLCLKETLANDVDPDQTPQNAITKTSLFKYIENFSSKNFKFSDKKL